MDLDLFRVGEFDAEQMLRELRAAGVPAHGAETQRSTLWFELEGVETRLMHFDRPVLQNPDDCLGVPVASVLDIAAMKIEAISSRGARKDFVDLYFICQEPGLGLAGAVAAFEARFASASPNVLHRVKALTYFDDAEREPELMMLKPVDWSEVRSFFQREAEAWWTSRRV